MGTDFRKKAGLVWQRRASRVGTAARSTLRAITGHSLSDGTRYVNGVRECRDAPMWHHWV